MNKRIPSILFVVRDFPPTGGGGVMRVTKFTKYLLRLGHTVCVLTSTFRDPRALDDTLLIEVENSFVLRTKSYEPINTGSNQSENITWGKVQAKSVLIGAGKRFYHFLKRYILIPDASVLWVLPSMISYYSYSSKLQCDFVIASGPPFSSFLLGSYIAKRKKAKLILDYRDDWLNNPLFYSGGFRSWIEIKLEQILIKKSSWVITTTKAMENSILVRNEFAANKISTITNGFDSEDFVKHNGTPSTTEFNIVYAGSVGGKRDLKPFLHAFKKLVDENTTFKHDARVIFAGVMASEYYSYCESLKGNFSFLGQLPHAEAVKLMVNADVLLLLIHTEEGSSTAYPGKLFELAAAQRPILALVSEGITKQLIESEELGEVCNPKNEEEIESLIKDFYNRWKDGSLKPTSVNQDLISAYDRKNTATQLSNLLKYLYV